MKEGHHVETRVSRLQAQRRPNVARRCADVAMQQRDDLRPRRGAGRVQNQRDVIRFRGAWRVRRPKRGVALRDEVENAGRCAVGDLQPDDENVESASRVYGFRLAFKLCI